MVIGCYMTPVNPSAVILPTSEVNDGPAQDKLSLTSLWDYVTRTQCLPENLDLDAFFCTVHERLKSPEWEIRQNALRVLVDFMPLLSVESLDERIGTIMPDLVNNLGHLGPAVRKGAVDALKTYLNLSVKPNAITRDLVEWGVERYQENKIPTNVVLGIVMCLPFVINGKLNDATINYIIHRLLDKIVKVVHQETVLRALVRIRDLIGGPKFDAALSTHDTYNCKRDFELLCGVYDLHLFSNTTQTRIGNYLMAKSETLTDSDESSVSVPGNNNDRVILETEIHLDSGPSITMKIHEETSPGANSADAASPASDRTSGRTFKVLPDLSLDDGYIDSVKRTPRRVRFGGEIVKLRTPDSDSNLDENDATISIISEGDQPVIEIKYIENETKTTTRTTRSLIPIPVKHTQSAPASPTGNNSTRSFARSKEYKSSPNLSRKVAPTWGKSRIPRRRNIEIRKTSETKIQININETTPKDLQKTPKKKLTRRETFSSEDFKSHQDVTNPSPKSPKTSSKQKEKKTLKKQTKPAIVIPPIHQIKREDQFSPIPRHNQIELFHNLTRSPSPRPEDDGPPFPSPSPLSSQQNILSHDETPVGPKKSEPVALPAITPGQETSTDENGINSGELAFHIYTSSEGLAEDQHSSPIPVNNSGDCLTCSSSGSETGIRVERFHSTHLDDKIIEDLQNMDDIKARQRGLEELLRVVRTPTVLDALQERLPSLFHILFSAVQHTTLQPIADEALTVIFGNMKQEALITRLQQICLSLAKLGSPSGIRLAIVLMRRVPPKLVVDQLLSESIIGAKSSKVREGALQIVMTVSRIYPSTDFNVHKSLRTVIRTLSHKKKKVRQAALETLAALAQITGNSMVLEVAQEVTSAVESPERQQILQVIRTRLSRKQLPTVNTNGTVQYSTPQGDSEIEWLSRGNSSSSSPSSPYTVVHTSPTNRIDTTKEQDDDRNTNRLVQRQSERLIGQRFIPSSARAQSNCNRETEQNEFDSANTSRRFVENYSPRSAMSAGVQSSEKKVNYWRNNARNQSTNIEQIEDLGSDWSSNKEESHEGQNGNRTQVWAIDPTAFTTVGGGKLSPANGTLRQVYVVKNEQDSKTTATNTDFRNASPARQSGRFRNPRGRSFSPSTTSRTGSYDSLPNCQHGQMQSQRSNPRHHQNTSHTSHTHNHSSRGRFVSGGHYNDRHCLPKGDHEPIRKSFSSEQITGLDRFRKEHTFSSGSSSSSSVRQGGGNWRDLRSGIPVPIYDSKLKIRTKNANNAGKTKGPMTIPYYPPVKSPSPTSTPENDDNRSANRQPFSSGSESSGYFTPPPETHHEPPATPELATPTLTPQVSPRPERFVRIETPRKLDSEPESFDDDDAPAVDDVSTKSEIRASGSLTSLNFVERTLSRNEATNSLEFAKVSFDDLDAQRRRQIDVEIATHVQRKTVGSAPALNDASFTPSPRPSTDKTTLPGACCESLVDTEAPEELYTSVSPEKKSPAKVVRSSVVARRKSSKYGGGGKCREASGDRPFAKPREAFHDICAQLESAEWEATMKGLQGLVRLIRHHRDVVENQMHAVCAMLGKHVRNLRSQVARNACYAAAELAKCSRRPLEMELDELATPLLHRTADTNKFLRSDANAALDEMSAQLSVPKLVSVITFRGSLHQNAVVRSASARLLCNIVQRLGAEKVFQLPRDTRDKILLAGANGLMEGSLETRQHAKMLLGLLAEHCQFQKAMTEAVPASILRHIDKTMRLLIK